MTELGESPEEEDQREFDELDSFGESTLEEYSGLKERLGEDEHVEAMSSARVKKDDKAVLCLTNKRVLIFNSGKTKLLGKRKQFDDIKLGQIQDIQVEERKDFDILKMKTEASEKKIMTPEGKGVEISGLIRQQQDLQENDPAEQLEKIGSEREKGNITEEEYQDKKDDLMDRI